MPQWTAAEATAMTRPQEVQVVTRRRDGSLRRPRTWVVADDSTVFIRIVDHLASPGPRAATLRVDPAKPD